MKNVFQLLTIDLSKPHNGTVYRVKAKYLFLDVPKGAKVVLEIDGMNFDASKISSIEIPHIDQIKVYSEPFNGTMKIYAINCGAKIESTSYTFDDLKTIINTTAQILKRRGL